jgi:hypothetical protein
MLSYHHHHHYYVVVKKVVHFRYQTLYIPLRNKYRILHTTPENLV